MEEKMNLIKMMDHWILLREENEIQRIYWMDVDTEYPKIFEKALHTVTGVYNKAKNKSCSHYFSSKSFKCKHIVWVSVCVCVLK